MYNPNTLGKYLRARRKEAGVTMGEVAYKIGIGQSQVCSVELGKQQSPAIATLEKFGKYYGIPGIELAKMIDIPSVKTKKVLDDYEDKL